MKKVILVLLIAAVMGSSAFALDLLDYPPPIAGRDILIDISVGFGIFGSSGWDLKVPPLSATAEYCLPIPVPVSVGGEFTFIQYGWNTGEHSWTYNFMIFAGRANWHWNFDVDRLDFYTGFSTGYRSFSKKYSGPNRELANSLYTWSYNGLHWAGQAGAHYYFTKNIGVMAEVGYPLLIKSGVALKF